MIEISVNKITKSFGFGNILDNISFDIMSGEVVSLIGSNGCGKSTLLKIIAGDIKEDSGTISIRNGSVIGYLKQNYETEYKSVKEILYETVKNITDIEENLRKLELKMQSATGNELNNILNKYGNLQEKFINLGGYEISEKVGRIITGFKLEKMLGKNFSKLSGGEKRIVKLASLMINNPNILLLDEPTNHLDIDTLEWFENYIKNYKGTIIIVSHDRYFLDKVSTKTILINNCKETIYHGNYSYYLEEFEKRELLEFEAYKNQQKQITAMKNSAKKLREWARIDGNERLMKRAICIERRLEKMNVISKPKERKDIPLNFETNKRSGNEVVVLNHYSLNMLDNVLLSDVNLEILYKDRVCLMGKNGTGKSTLIKRIINRDENIKVGNNVNIGYIPQEIVFDNDLKTVFEVARNFFDGEDSHLRSALTKFMFFKDNIFKRVDKLSGGEKVRLKLFELVNRNTNFLILDEPTNHLDIETREVLETALDDYEGTVLFISHDRYFINKLANKIVYIDNKKLNTNIGNYDDYKNTYN